MKVSERTIVFLILVGSLLFAIPLLFLHAERQKQERTFFSEALRTAQTETSVSVAGQMYHVQSGEVFNERGVRTGGLTELEALQLAYASEITENSPLLGISGTDPDSLKNAVAQLKVVRTRLAQAQKTAHEQLLVERALYPIDFLSGLADTESAREDFLHSGSRRDYTAYTIALSAAILEGKKGAHAYEEAINDLAGTSTNRILNAGGILTTKLVLASIQAIEKRFDDTEMLLRSRIDCVRGTLSACDPRNLLVATPTTSPAAAPVTQNFTNEIRSIRADALNASFASRASAFALSSSTCLALLPSPYYFYEGQDPFQAQFSGDLIFYSTTQKGGTTVSYLKDTYGISFAVANQMLFYQCPDAQNDIGMMRAILSVASFARAHPSFHPDLAQKLLRSGTVFESDARTYIRKALVDNAERATLTRIDKDQLTSIARMFSERSAGLDMLIRQITSVETTDATIISKGVPFDLDAKTLFLTHSAFPSLFLASNNSASAIAAPLREQGTEARTQFQSNFFLYSTLRWQVPREKLVSDIRAFFDFENR